MASFMQDRRTNNSNINKALQKHQMEHKQLAEAMNANTALKYLPLHRFSNSNICDTIKLWVYNDLNYNKYLLQTMQTLWQCSISGELISDQSLKNVKRILEKELLTFMTYKTFNIMFRNLNKLKNEDQNEVKTKTAEEIGYILFNYPLKCLLNRINDSHDIINGQKYIDYYQRNKNWIEKVTGWDREDIYQIHSVLFRNLTLTTAEIVRNIENIPLKDQFGESIANIIQTRIVPQFDLEELYCQIRNGQSVTKFSDAIVNLVDESVVNNEENKENNDFVQNMYQNIAECLISSDKQTDNDALSLNQNKEWICGNCGNYNHLKLIKSAMTTDLSICTLCGIKQSHSVILQIKACETYITGKDNALLEHKNDSIDESGNEETKMQIVVNSTEELEYNTLAESNASYGFGVDHSHAHLSGIYDAIKEEMLSNALHSLTMKQFESLLIKAIEIHKTALGNEYKNDLICQYFQWEYNIIRNDAIGIRHILSIITYTDVVEFCAVFKSTYQMINDETQEDQVTQRHRQLYHYARALFESVQFFGQSMPPKLSVYHVLKHVMRFDKFSAYFNQPISSTTSLATAQELSGGVGIILCLKSGFEYFDDYDPAKVPKYLSISWMSASPSEDQKLFYGENVHFQICDIIEAASMKGHSKELAMLNQFQKMVQNQDIEWQESAMIDGLESMIKNQQQINERNESKFDSEPETEYITKYGKDLFAYFCDNINTKSVVIKNYKLLPFQLLNALFFRQNKNTISLIPMARLFKNVNEITLNDLNMQQMTAEAKNYLNIALEYINEYEKDISLANLKQIRFQSLPQKKRKEDAILKQLEMKYFAAFSNVHWSLMYTFELTTLTHSLTFVNNATAANTGNNRQSLQWKNNLYGTETVMKPRKSANLLDIGVISDEIHAKYAAFEDIQSPEFATSLLAYPPMSTLGSPSTSLSLRAFWDQMPPYFMQITQICEDVFYIHLKAAVTQDKMTRRLRVINISDQATVNKSMTIYRKKDSATTDVEIVEEHSPSYHLAIFDPKNTDDQISYTNHLQFTVLKNENEYPPINSNYAPQSVDVSTLIKVKNHKNGTVNIYWSVPTLSFGEITYKIVTNAAYNMSDDGKSDNTEVDIGIQLLPYSIPIASIPMSFQIITVATIDGKQYASEPSENIFVGQKGVYINETFIEAYQNEEDHIISVLAPNTNRHNSIKNLVKSPLAPSNEPEISYGYAITDEKYDETNSLNSESTDGEDEETSESEARELIESFLDLNDPQINWKMIEFLSKENMTHILMSYLSRLPLGAQIFDTDFENNSDDIIQDTLPLSSDDIDEIRANELSYSLLSILANDNGCEPIKSFMFKKMSEICLHVLAVFHPCSKGNKYHARVMLDILLEQYSQTFLATLVNVNSIKHIQSLFKCAVFRNLNQGNLNSFVLDLIGFQTNNDSNNKNIGPLQSLKRKLIKMLCDWKFVQYILFTATNPKHGDNVTTQYSNFFVDLIARCSFLSECAELFKGYENLMITSFVTALLDKNGLRTTWHRMSCGDCLVQTLDILSRQTLDLNGDNRHLDQNVLHSMFSDMLHKAHTFVPNICEIIMNPSAFNVKLNAIKFSHGEITKPFGIIRLNCLDLLVVCTDFAQFECGQVLGLMPMQFWERLLDLVFLNRYNNMFLTHFRRLIHLSMIFRRRILKHLFVNCSMLGRFVEFYENKSNKRTELHSYVLQMLSDIYSNDIINVNEEANDAALEPNFSTEIEDEWDIIPFFNASNIWQSFGSVVESEMRLQNDANNNDIGEEENDVNMGKINGNEQQLDQLLESLLTGLQQIETPSPSDQESNTFRVLGASDNPNEVQPLTFVSKLKF